MGFQEVFDGGDLPVLGPVVGKARRDGPDVGIQLPRSVGELPGALQVIRGLRQRSISIATTWYPFSTTCRVSIAALVPMLTISWLSLLFGIEWTYIGFESVCDSAVVEVALNCAASQPRS